MPKIQEVLLNTYLDLSREGSNLRDMAYAKAVMWVLFAEGKSLDAATITKNIAQLCSFNGLPPSSITNALKILSQRKLVIEKSGKWELSPAEKNNIDRQIKHSSEVTEKIVTKRFPSGIEKSKLRGWFDEVNSQYFSAGADKLIALYTNHQKPLFNVESILKPIIRQFGLNQYEKELSQGYKEFLTSDDREEGEKILNLMRSLLSSRLVSANIGPEVLSLEKYKNAEIILDTNVLFAMRLYRGDELKQAFDAFGKVMKFLAIKLFITDFTKEEYETVRTRKRQDFVTITKSVSKNIFDGMSQSSDITKSMLESGCSNTEDIERFFDVTLAIPEEIGEVKIDVLSDGQIKGSHYNPDTDSELFGQIQGATLQRRGREKAEITAIHDLRLMKLALKKSRSKKTFVLTLDGAMETLALDKVSDKEEPLWISLYSLVQILAINGAGPDFNPNDLAPFIKMFMEFEEATKEEKYDDRDLLLIIEKTDRINELPETKIISLLNQLHRVKLKRSTEEAVREVIMELDRTLRQNANKTDTALKDKQGVIDSLNQENQQKDKELKEVGSALQKEKTKKTIFWFCVRVTGYLALALLLAWYLQSEILNAYNQNFRYDLISMVVLIGGAIGFAFTDYFSYTKPRLEKIKL